VSADVAGQASALTVLTPIAPGREIELRMYLESLRTRPSPLKQLRRTHFGRFVVVPDLVAEGERGPDHLTSPQLLFTACLDGDLDSYLDELCDALAPEAQEIWGRCEGCPEPAQGAALKAYLADHRIRTGFFVAAYPGATVSEVTDAVDQRERLIAFAQDAQDMDPKTLQREFHRRFGN
jgi:hypothetical protein